MTDRLLTHMAATLGCMMTTTAVLSQATDREPRWTGASLAWTSTDPLLLQARSLLAAGKLADAQTLVHASALPAADEMRQIIPRIRYDYCLDHAAMLAKLRHAIPDVSADDLARWQTTDELQHRSIDGQIAYFRREPSNLFRFSAEARRRRDAHTTTRPGDGTFVTEKHLAEVIAAAQAAGKPDVAPLRHRIRYSIGIPPNHPAAKPGALVRCWLPFPQEHPRQRDIRLLSTSPQHPIIAPAGNGHRSIYIEQHIADPQKPVLFKLAFEYTSVAYYPILNDSQARTLPPSYDGSFLSQRPPHIVFTPQLRETLARVIAAETNPLAKARRIFQFIHTDIQYCAEEEYGIIPSFTEKALRTRKGDCGIQTMLFIAMCRCAGIPARWQSGWETRPMLWNMHDWAEFYVEPWGWLPADPSYGLRESGDPKVRYFYFGHQDSYRMIVNLDYGAPLVPAKKSLRSEPADFQRGEVEIDGRNLYFNEWEYDIEVEYGET